MKLPLLVTTCIWGVLGVLGLLPAMFSVMLFDAPGSENNPATVTLFWCVLTFPVVCGASIVVAWVLYSIDRDLAALVSSLAPLINILIGAFALICMELFYAGKFNG